MDNNISFEEKKEFILKYLLDNFSTDKKNFLKDKNMSEEFLARQLNLYSMTKTDYFLLNIAFQDNVLFLHQPNLINDFQDNKFFVIQALDQSERKEFEKLNSFINYHNKDNYYQQKIIEKNEFISFLIQFTHNNSYDNLFFSFSGINPFHLDKLYYFIHNKLILEKF